MSGSVAASALPEHLGMLRDSARDVFSRRCGPARLRSVRAGGGDFDRAFWREMAGLGWAGLRISEAHGGLGLGVTELAAIAELAGMHLVPEPIVPVAGFAARLLDLAASGPHKRRLLPAIVAGECVPAVAWQRDDPRWLGHEAAGASAIGRGDGLELSGSARFARPGQGCDAWLVAAGYGDALALVWIPVDTARLAARSERLADGSIEACLSFDRAQVARENVLSLDARASLRRAIDETLILLAAEMLGVARRAYEITLEYLRTRSQFGQPIGGFQALQHRAVDCLIQRELAAAVVAAAAAAADAGAGAEELGAWASRAKARCADAALGIVRESVQMHGAIGFTDECDVGLYLKRALALAAWLGNAVSHRRRFASLASDPELP